MKILHTIGGLGAKSGGTSTCTYDLLSAMQQNSCNVELLTPAVIDADDKLLGVGEEWIKVLPNDCCSPFAISKNIKNFLVKSDYDLYHTNGLWMYVIHITAAIARQKGKPYIISPHGMLYPQALHRSYWKKLPLIHLYFKKDIRNATCIHATCRQEMEYVRQFGYEGAVAVISNPVVMPDFTDLLFKNKESFLINNQRRKFGFLGRLHSRKAVENLIYGMSGLGEDASRAELVIMGKGDDSYEQFLHSEVERLGLKNVTFAGFVNGRQKYEQLSELSALFVPSDFENFGMIVTEALSVGTPVMASLGTPWEELNTHRCGWWIDRSPENITSVMQQVLELSTDELLQMGQRGMELVKNNYSADKVALQMKQLYEWILNKCEKPEFVYN
ncbi:MAG: glycosyltransferase [Prevotellaceae bacterium]|jgi:glycosyltransferase involved in cell wall biosynthesis|nr:glycosyltransferase [Prevotellaceae bacterium]